MLDLLIFDHDMTSGYDKDMLWDSSEHPLKFRIFDVFMVTFRLMLLAKQRAISQSNHC
jgi:hypothetical protein